LGKEAKSQKGRKEAFPQKEALVVGENQGGNQKEGNPSEFSANVSGPGNAPAGKKKIKGEDSEGT